MARWDRIRFAFLIYVAVWAAGVGVLLWLFGHMVIANAIWDCDFQFGPNGEGDPAEPAEPYCTVARIQFFLQLVVAFLITMPAGSALSLLPLVMLAFFAIDVLLPWWRRWRRQKGQEEVTARRG